jgi:transposase
MYEDSLDSYAEVADEVGIGPATLKRWVQAFRETGTVAPRARGGGWCSPVALSALHALVHERPDMTTDELTRAYNRRVPQRAWVHRSSILRALPRSGYVFKNNGPGPRNLIIRASQPDASPTGGNSET